MKTPKALLAGESWMVHSIHQKGFDSFTTTEYAEGGGHLIAALEQAGWDVTYQPAHVAARDFPETVEALAQFDVVILSDVGANTLLLHPDTFAKAEKRPDRLAAIRDYVKNGGGLIMVGGYLTFQGIDAKAQYAGTPVEDALPAIFQRCDDRVEKPSGVVAKTLMHDHPMLKDVPADWPALLGYNRAQPRDGADVIAVVDGDPLIAGAPFGQGRGVIFSSDCGPHWAPQDFVEWHGYGTIWANMANWAAGRIG